MKHRHVVVILISMGGLLLWLANWSHISWPGSPSTTQEQTAGELGLANGVAAVLGEPVVGWNNIFFVESSCGVRGAERTSISMSPRQACAVESAALTNPSATIYLLDTCLDRRVLSKSQPAADHVVHEALRHGNVRVFSMGLRELAQGTPLEAWFYSGRLQSSSFPVEHSSDIARLLLLWKYGGIYVDLDFVFIRSLENLGMDFAVAERDNWIANGVLSFSATGLGHAIADRCLKELAANFDGSVWSSNGPAIITKVLSILCNSSSVKEMSQERCWGFTVHPPALFYPFRYMSWWLMFEESSSDAFMDFVLKNSTYGVHAWNKMSHSKQVDVTSKQPYALLAKRFCPGVFSAVGPIF